MRLAAVICSTLIGLVILPSQTVAGQKTIKACQEEWRANKAANQANGITEKSYVDQCREGGAPTHPTAAPEPSIAPPPSTGATARPSTPTQTVAGQKTIKACQEDGAIQQSCQLSERHHGKVLRGSMSRRWCSHSPNRRSGCIFSGPYSGSHTDRANTPCA
jgi:hypothetical protein